jgi:hypothetical protein
VIGTDYLPAQRTLARSAAWLTLLTTTLAVGSVFAWHPQLVLPSIGSGGVGAVATVCVAWSMPMLRYGPAGQGRLALVIMLASWAGMLAPLMIVSTGLRGMVGQVAFVGLAAIPALLASLAWVDGFRGQR